MLPDGEPWLHGVPPLTSYSRELPCEGQQPAAALYPGNKENLWSQLGFWSWLPVQGKRVHFIKSSCALLWDRWSGQGTHFLGGHLWDNGRKVPVPIERVCEQLFRTQSGVIYHQGQAQSGLGLLAPKLLFL